MLITKIELLKKNLYGIYIDYEFLFALYFREIRQHQLEEKKEISKEQIESIGQDIIMPRAKKKAMDLLLCRDRTKEELRKKLKENFFHSQFIEEAISYVESYGYINDRRYVENYCICYQGKKSKKQIEYDLKKKGVSTSILKEYMEQEEWNEVDILIPLVQKRCFGKDLQDEKERQKQYAYFLRRGFSYENIKKAFTLYLTL